MTEFTAHDPYTNHVLYELVQVANNLQSLTINTDIPETYRKRFGSHLKSVRAGMRELNRLDRKIAKIHSFTEPKQAPSESSG